MPDHTQNDYYATSAVEIIRQDGMHLPAYDPAMLYQEAVRLGLHIGNWYGRANSITIPRGREPGRAWLLMRRDYLSDSQLDSWKTQPVSISFSLGTTPVLFKNFYFVQATAIYADDATDTSNNTLFLVEFADPRIHFLATTIDGDQDWDTWDNFLEYLWGELPDSAGTYPALPTLDAALTPEKIVFNGQNTWDAIIGILEMLACGVVYDPIVGEFDFYDGTEQQLPPSDTCVCTLSTNHKESTAFFPEKFRVYFPAGWISYNSWNGTLLTSGPTVDTDHYIDVETSIDNAKAGTIAQVVYPIGASSTLTLQNVADALVARHAARVPLMANCGYRQYQGILDPALPGSEISEVRWYDYGGGMFTELYAQNTSEHPWPELYRPVTFCGDSPGVGIDSYVLLQELHAKGAASGVLLDDESEPTGEVVILYDYTRKSGHWNVGQVVLVPHGSTSVIGGNCQIQET